MIRSQNDFIILCQTIDQMMKKNQRQIIAIDGPCGSGKSSLAKMLGEKYEANIFHLDDYFLTPELRSQERLKEPGGNVDYERFYHEIILGVMSNESFSYFKYNCKSNAMERREVHEPKPLSIVEGSYSLHPYLRDAYDLKVFITIEPEIQIKRIFLRNGEDIALRFLDEWIPLENFYFRELSIKEVADIVIDGSKAF
ncbi:MAG: (d)CMP kinase [Anaerovoracaceae bacterium]|nr:(d)CMP kinase [Anaerovoracaceae bacterium]